MAKGFHQHHGLDYDETFSPVVKPTTIRTVLSLVVSSGWSLQQLDVKNAFLHGFLKETVFMTQPLGFVFRHSSQVMILLLYVDDIVLTGSDSSLLCTFISTLGVEFEIKDLGPLHYFLGIEVTSLHSGIHLF